ncbi:MAG TPA: CoB--CoM heterodisulfide reductase iron-sulfur subunit A family protein, partial [Syntrophaceae bacterium]|nr:CoB--CoM heterodisulfide reductase iron-sulfur subunit A family protein [Syntrophaceae bacterium]
KVLVIGGGIAGIQASLDLADKGIHVYLVEKEPSIGGHMALLDKTFPTNDCSMCILAPKMNDCDANDNIEILSYSEVTQVKGKAGNFRVKVKRKARYVNERKCTGCGECVAKCPKKVPNKYNSYLDMRKAIYLPFPQAVPRVMTIDAENCLYLTKGKCGTCKKVCTAGAVDYDQKDLEEELKVGAIIVATGFEVFVPKEMAEYGYGKYENVLTAMEYERLICASGPTGGHLKTALLEVPKSIAFIQCVGSRDLQHNPYCCSVCCMHATKEAILAKEHYEDIEAYIFYTDLRAVGKGFQEYVNRAKEEYGIKYIRARPGKINEDKTTKKLTIWYDDTVVRKVKSLEVDLAVLCTTLKPNRESIYLGKILGIHVDEYGFFKVKDALYSPLDTNVNGIFVAGFCESPKDIPESVMQGSGAAARAAEILAYEMASLEYSLRYDKEVVS